MSALPSVSLIVVNWNGSAYIGDCLTSLLALDYPAFSVSVVDNASTDEFARICAGTFSPGRVDPQSAQPGLRRWG